MSAIKKRKLLKELKVSKQWQDVFYAFGDFMVTKIYRRYAQIFALYQMDAILKEIAKRFNLSKNKPVTIAIFFSIKNKMDFG